MMKRYLPGRRKEKQIIIIKINKRKETIWKIELIWRDNITEETSSFSFKYIQIKNKKKIVYVYFDLWHNMAMLAVGKSKVRPMV